jgi:hypothetical protein
MEIYKIPACWPTSFIFGIPLSGKLIYYTDMLKKENTIEIKYKNVTSQNTIKLDKVLLDFIFQFCSVN